jgi:hypothetical protein
MRGRRPRQPSAQPQGEGDQIFGVFEAWTAGASREFPQNSELFLLEWTAYGALWSLPLKQATGEPGRDSVFAVRFN